MYTSMVRLKAFALPTKKVVSSARMNKIMEQVDWAIFQHGSKN